MYIFHTANKKNKLLIEDVIQNVLLPIYIRCGKSIPYEYWVKKKKLKEINDLSLANYTKADAKAKKEYTDLLNEISSKIKLRDKNGTSE